MRSKCRTDPEKALALSASGVMFQRLTAMDDGREAIIRRVIPVDACMRVRIETVEGKHLVQMFRQTANIFISSSAVIGECANLGSNENVY